MSKNTPLIAIQHVSKQYDNGLIKALSDVDFEIQKGFMYALEGPSGCGKSTLLNIIGTLDTATSGSVLYEGKVQNQLTNLHDFRRDFIGFIFQFHHLIPTLTLRENIESAMLFNKSYSKVQRKEKVNKLLKEFALSHRENSYVTHLSGGERQRGAIARAFANEPRLILADEPTGNVDSNNAKIILQMMQKYIKETNATILIATHDPIVSSYADYNIIMQDGKIISQKSSR